MSNIDKLAWIHIVDRRLLITRSEGKDTYYIPGGKREEGETDIEALTREVREELTVDLVLGDVKYLETFSAQAHGKPEGVMVVMTCYIGSYTGEIQPASEIAEVAWFAHADKEHSSEVDQIIFDWLKEQDFID